MSPIFFTGATRSAVCRLPGVFSVVPSAVTVNGEPLNAPKIVELPIVDQHARDAAAAVFTAPGQLIDERHLQRVRPVPVRERPVEILDFRNGHLVIGSQCFRPAQRVVALQHQPLRERPRDTDLQRVIARPAPRRVDLDVALTSERWEAADPCRRRRCAGRC